VGDTLYAVGGLAERTFVPVNTLWLYREDRNGWEPRAALPAPRGASAVGVVNGELIVVGGWGAGRRLMAASAIYDPAKDRWRVGGEARSAVFANPEVYDPAADRWAAAPPLPVARHGLAAAAVGGRLYVIGGGPKPGFAQTDAVDVFTP